LINFTVLCLFLSFFASFFPRTADNNNSVALDWERTIPTERPPLVGEVSVNFADCGCRGGTVRPYSRLSRLKLLLYLPSSSSVVLTRTAKFHTIEIGSPSDWKDGLLSIDHFPIAEVTLLDCTKFLKAVCLG
jgi:hypothetical protein